jgi:SecD/SecF fusion protein
MGSSGRGVPSWLKLDFIGRRNVWFGFSSVVLAIAILAIGVRGLNFGIDFEGGTQVTFKTPQPVSLEDVRGEAAGIGQADAVIQGRGASTNDAYSDFSIRTESLTQQEVASLEDSLTETLGAQAFGVKNVSESFGGQIANSALLAIFVSLLLICAYISLRFQWKFAVPTLVALAHDVIIAVGIYALVGREVTTATVAAVLTILGYSIYDTIIIFDRIRENMPIMRKASFRVIGNVSLWEVIPRSLATTFITLLPIACLYLFGGDTLKDFAFALLVGIGAGAYSSIFIAAPLLALFKEREPEYRRRRDDETELAGMETVGGALAMRAPVAEEAPAAEAEEELVGASAPAAPAPPAPTPAPTPAVGGSGSGGSSARREKRRQRRSTRPHGRAR